MLKIIKKKIILILILLLFLPPKKRTYWAWSALCWYLCIFTVISPLWLITNSLFFFLIRRTEKEKCGKKHNQNNAFIENSLKWKSAYIFTSPKLFGLVQWMCKRNRVYSLTNWKAGARLQALSWKTGPSIFHSHYGILATSYVKVRIQWSLLWHAPKNSIQSPIHG